MGKTDCPSGTPCGTHGTRWDRVVLMEGEGLCSRWLGLLEESADGGFGQACVFLEVPE